MTSAIPNSLLFAGIASSLATVFGVAAFAALATSSQRIRMTLIISAIACLLTPAFLQAGAWMDFAMKVGLPYASLPFGAFVLSLQLWPIVTLLLLAMSRHLDTSLLESARLSLTRASTWTRVILPLLSPALALGWVAAFILALNNFIIPTTFQTHVQITEIYVEFQSLYNTSGALLQSIPIWIVSMIALVLAARLTVRMRAANRHTAADSSSALQCTPLPGGFAPWILFSLVLLGLSIVPPLSRIITACCHENIWTSLQLARPQFGASLAYAVGSTVLATSLACVVWIFCRKWKLEWVLATPFILSGFFLGVLLIAISQWAGKYAWWQGTWTLVIAALAIRFIWIPYKAAATAHSRINSDILDAAQIFRLPRSSVLRFIEWPALRPSLLAAAWVVYVLALWDVETLVMIYPPGGEPVSLRIYQLLHYGYDAQVGVLSLGLLAMGIAPGLALLFFRSHSANSVHSVQKLRISSPAS